MKNLFAKFKRNAKFESSKKILMLLISLQILVLGITMYVLGSRGGGVGSNSGSYVPVWIAVMIPVIASSKKFDAKKEKKAFWMFLIGLGFFVLLGMLVFLFKVLK